MNLLVRSEKSDGLAWCVNRCLRFIEQRNDVLLSGSDFDDGEQPDGHVIRQPKQLSQSPLSLCYLLILGP